MKPRLYRGDCKIIADRLIKEGVKVDLIYLDPPFNSNRTYSMLFNHRSITGQQKAYHDMWDFTDSTRQLVLDFETELNSWELPESFKKFMEAWMNILKQGSAQDKKLLNYLMYMTQRLVRFKELLAEHGNIYFHCDSTASHYIKVIMDGIWGRKNFLNEIIWQRTITRKGNVSRGLASDSDTIFRYGSDDSTWNPEAVIIPYNLDDLDEKTKKKYNRVDEHGRLYQLTSLNAPKQDPDSKLTYEVMGVTRTWRWTRERMEQAIKAGKIIQRKPGNVPRQIRYLDEQRGKTINNIWIDIPAINSQAKERRGYATQKPVKLLDRIVRASSNKDAIVFDPFCGCGTSIEAAHVLERNWIGIDISGSAVDEIKDRMAEHGVYEGQDYDLIEGSPDTMAEYKRLNPYDKQDWLVRRLDGLPNPKKSGDEGIDGDMTFHLGMDKSGSDRWGRMVFSVKTGKQRKPEHVRELRGTMKAENADMGVLILDADPTEKMEEAAQKAGQLKYQLDKTMPPKHYDRIQIITASEIIEGGQLDCPPSMHEVKTYRKLQGEMQV